MAFERPKRIREVVEAMHAREYVLPSIQRELVWKPEQMERLWDSILSGYPIGSFLFWAVDQEHKNEYQFYEFICDFHERDRPHNPKANVSSQPSLTAVLDGQQRLTALYLGLLGSRSDYRGRGWRSKDASYPKRILFLNLACGLVEDEEQKRYDFKFLTEQQAQARDETQHWFRVGRILELSDPQRVSVVLKDEGLESNPFANEALWGLWRSVHERDTVNYYLEKAQDLGKVLNIFVRLNNGGTPLEYSDLLLSIATSQWSKRDAREEIYGFVDELNRLGEGIQFDKDLVLKACLVLNDIPDVKFDVKNFNRANMLRIEDGWERSSTALRLAVECAMAFGFNARTLVAKNALVPMAYYLLRRNAGEAYVRADRYREDRELMRTWLVLSHLRGIFGRAADQVLRIHRDVISSSTGGFPLRALQDELRERRSSLRFSDDDLDVLMETEYGEREAFLVLSLICPWVKFSERFHVDHVHPQAGFDLAKLSAAGFSEEERWPVYFDRNKIANLQLLEGNPNEEKQDKAFDEWLRATYPEGRDRSAYSARNFIPEADLNIRNFRKFYASRREIMKAELKRVLDSALGTT